MLLKAHSFVLAGQIQAIGLASKYGLPDSSFSALSSRVGNEALQGRLTGPKAWSPSTDNNANDYLQIDLQHEFFICAIATQGNPNADHWTKKFKVHLSVNNKDWVTYQENNVDKVCLNSLNSSLLSAPVYPFFTLFQIAMCKLHTFAVVLGSLPVMCFRITKYGPFN